MKRPVFLPIPAVALLDKDFNVVFINEAFSAFIGVSLIADDLKFQDLCGGIRLKNLKFEHVFSPSKIEQETEITIIDESTDFSEILVLDLRYLVEVSKDYPTAKYCFKITKSNAEQALLYKKACMAETDRLTSLPNRLALEQLLKRYQENKVPFKICFFDMNGFKKINDTFGHKVGDNVLREIAQRFLSFSSSCLKCFRLGGDEFIVIITSNLYRKETIRNISFGEDLEERNVLMLAQHLKDPIKVNGREFNLSSSIGVCCSEDAVEIEDLISCADSAMYVGKKTKKSDVIEFNKEDASTFSSQGELESALKDAFMIDGFEQEFQPVGDILSGRTLFAEALLRWKDPQGIVHQPEFFFPIAHKAGMMLDIDKWSIKATIVELATLQNYGVYLPLSVNISADALTWRGLPEYIKECLIEYKISPKLLNLEITESILMENMDQCKASLTDLVNFGVTVSLDDFGSNNSSYLYLLHLPISVIKIDKAFLNKLQDTNSYHIVDSICKISHKLGLKVVAEGVEELSQINLLKKLNCDYVQGFWYSRGMQSSELAAFVKTKLPNAN